MPHEYLHFIWVISGMCLAYVKSSESNFETFPSVKNLVSSSDCKTLPFDMVISIPGCKNHTEPNNLCKGLCTSLFVPHQGLRKFKIETCLACKPKKTYKKIIFLQCYRQKAGNSTLFLKPITVKKVEECECGKCKLPSDREDDN